METVIAQHVRDTVHHLVFMTILFIGKLRQIFLKVYIYRLKQKNIIESKEKEEKQILSKYSPFLFNPMY